MEFLEFNYSNSNIKIVSSQINLGFAGGNNLGYQHSKGELIVLLNNDTLVEKDWLIALVDSISSHKNIAMTQSLVITEGINEKFYRSNGTINLLGHNIMNVFPIDENGRGEILLANGCSLMICRSLLEEIDGLFLDEYFAYAEDTFLSLKVKFAGYKIVHTSKSIVHHKGGGTSKSKSSSFIFFYQERNRILNFLLFFSKRFRSKYYPYLISNFLMKFFIGIFSKKYSVKGLIEAYVWLIKHRDWIKHERKNLEKIKKYDEEDVLKFISGKMFNGKNFIEKIGNFKSLLYCRILKINVVEISQGKK